MSIRWLDDISESDEREVGKKATALAEIDAAGMNVPRGFVVTARTFEDIIRNNGLENEIEAVLSRTDRSDLGSIRRAYNQIHTMVHNIELPVDVREDIEDAYENINMSQEVRDAGGTAVDFIGGQRETEFVAVRASPTGARIPGVHETRINVNGKDSVIEAVKACWASLYSVEALAVEDEIGELHSMAVLVQRMVEPEVSGAMFDRNPVRGQDGDESYIIESLYGLGTALSNGTTTPDRYVVDSNGGVRDSDIVSKEWKVERDPTSGKTIKQRVSSQQREERSLTTAEIENVTDAMRSLTERVGRNVMIDFAFSRNKLYVLDYDRFWRSEHRDEQDSEPFLEGRGASSGTVTGPATIVYNDTDIETIDDGNILVSVNASNRLTPVVGHIGAVVADNGGISSNLASIARALQVPCVVGAQNATDMLTRGEDITVDGGNGTIHEGAVQTSVETPESVSPSFDTDALTATDVKVFGQRTGIPADGAVITEYTDYDVVKELAHDHRPHRVWARTRHMDGADRDNIGIIVSPRDGDVAGKGVVLDSYGAVMRARTLVDRGASFLGIDVRRLRQEDDVDALHNTIEKIVEDAGDHCETAVLLEDIDPRVIEDAVEHGVGAVVVHPEDVSSAQRLVARAEKRFMLEKLRQL